LVGKIKLYTKATKMSLENAEQWIADAKLLLKNSSFGHANALLRFACEEIAKAYACWLTSEKMFPKDNMFVKNVFLYHWAKNEIILGMLLFFQWISANPKWQEMDYEDFKLSEEQIAEFDEVFETVLVSMSKMRQKAMYVDVDEKTNEVTSPLKIDEKELRGVLEVTELLLKTIKITIEETSEEYKEKFRKVFASLSEKAWETGKTPFQWFNEKAKFGESE
jgi:AbiV family abortive infection protein